MKKQPQLPLTEDEVELYDRQIRLWGTEAQARLRNGKLLVIGMGGLGAEVVKNIVLSGVNRVKMVDTKLATEEDLDTQFLIPPDALNKNRAEASQGRAQALNPLVSVEYESVSNYDFITADYIKDFDLVICLDQETSVNLKVDELCRNREPEHAGFMAGGVYGTFGFAFNDLNVHTYTREKLGPKRKPGEDRVRMAVLTKSKYPSLKEVLEQDLSDLADNKDFKSAKIAASCFLFKILLKFEEKFGRRPRDCEEDIVAMQNLRSEVLGNLTTDRLPDSIFRCVSTASPSPICAIVGALIAQEAVKIITKNSSPMRNFFFFDPLFLAGHFNYIGPSKPGRPLFCGES